ncbi:D-tagatose-bisphosphate aldolase, class II, non-catalytic subunit [Serratia quinivorans]|jgi:D-tagatose-1,6-bisphosphate aldolase subunit GatZ/KbaZ|uniref:D-tagatose-bisphosphate aldolase, class II, non-catalytic subunit n=1 Tax=Serratia quinivorans TaxID=137545 RepID=UPI00217A9711|nr:D-tagatose-bisphosphate aldolase, class II, non-catalytic subunit [Serratia quinivorans]CAI1163137.1 D-tagatose-1,6-bisphosphate aldolase subunit kbaZ [Serratia quinivorans]CAI1719164.1 D-tagatose-1,6-bisphosphate aldolase subunit kbaZ [Serratia quinivorans]
MQQLLQLVEQHKAGKPVGVFSVCSAHPWVLKAALRQARARGTPVLVEATSNQVNQFGGYTGQTAQQFRDALWQLADEVGLSRDRLWLGGDHLGPNAWQDRPAEEAMQLAETLIDDYVRAGFRKIHLDCSMSCVGDPFPLNDETVAVRAARLCAIAERAWQESGGEPPVYVIGTEVPVPGGAQEALEGMQVTTPQAVQQTLEVHRLAWQRAELVDAWRRTIALVVQPGVEFDHHSVEHYQPQRAHELSRFIERQPGMVYEAHSTDYQPPQAYRQLVGDHFAILKVGPALTFALREALFALDHIEREWLGEHQSAQLCATLEQVMREQPQQWSRYYHGNPHQQYLDRHYSLSDRVRYYWPQPQVQLAVERLIDNLRRNPVPLALLSQYLPDQARAMNAGELSEDPQDWVMHKVTQVLDDYHAACYPEVH